MSVATWQSITIMTPKPKIHLASDHAGFEYKELLKSFLVSEGHEVIDHGPSTYDKNDDYPDFIAPLARAVGESNGQDKGIILGFSGQGEAMVANRTKGIRAAVYYGGNLEIIKLSREHNDSNVLSLAAGFLTIEEAKSATSLLLTTQFSNEERHVRRVNKIESSQ